MDYLAGLTDEQRSVVTSPLGAPLLVLAGPGTGKTKILASRILYLLREKKVGLDYITAVTFTTKAAEEMKQRLKIRANALCDPIKSQT